MIPAPLAEIVEDFAASPREMRLQMLLGYAQGLPDLPDRYADQDALERVQECQTPFFLATELAAQGRVHMHFDCPPESPTVRGFAGILQDGLEGATVDEVLAVPNDFYAHMGLQEVVSPQRLRGFGAILGRLKRQVQERGAAQP